MFDLTILSQKNQRKTFRFEPSEEKRVSWLGHGKLSVFLTCYRHKGLNFDRKNDKKSIFKFYLRTEPIENRGH